MANMQQLEKYQKKERNMDSLDQVEMVIDNGRWIMEILFKRLYTNPPQSICREIISNAIDAQKRVKVTKPIEITYPTDTEPMVVVRDFGVGMNEEEIRNVYTKIGKTTKTLHDDEIGGFGIGSKSPFAYGDFQIESVKDGEKVIAWIYQDSGGSFVLKMIKEQSTEETGTAIKIPVKGMDVARWRDWLAFYQNAWGGQEVNYKRDLKVATSPYCKRVVEKFLDSSEPITDVRYWINSEEVSRKKATIVAVFTWRGVPYEVWDKGAQDPHIRRAHIIEFVLDPDKVTPTPSREELMVAGKGRLSEELGLRIKIHEMLEKQIIGPWAFDERMTQQELEIGMKEIQPSSFLHSENRKPYIPGVKVKLKEFDWYKEPVLMYEKQGGWGGKSPVFVPSPTSPSGDAKSYVSRWIRDRNPLYPHSHKKEHALIKLPEGESPQVIELHSRGVTNLFAFRSDSVAIQRLQEGVEIPLIYEVDGISVESPFKPQIKYPNEDALVRKGGAKKRRWKTNNYRQLDLSSPKTFLELWQKTRGYSVALSTLTKTCFSTKPIDPTKKVFVLDIKKGIPQMMMASIATVMLFPTEEPIQIVTCSSESKKKSLKERLGPLYVIASSDDFYKAKNFDSLFYFFSKKEKAALFKKVEAALKKRKVHLLLKEITKGKSRSDRVEEMMKALIDHFPNLVQFCSDETWYRTRASSDFFGVLGGIGVRDLRRSEEFTIPNFYALCLGPCYADRSWQRKSKKLERLLTWDSVLNLIERTGGALGNE